MLLQRAAAAVDKLQILQPNVALVYQSPRTSLTAGWLLHIITRVLCCWSALSGISSDAVTCSSGLLCCMPILVCDIVCDINSVVHCDTVL